MQDFLPFMQQHWQLSSALLIVFALLIIVEFLRQKLGGKRLNAAQATQMINHQHAVVVDIRSTDNYQAGHIIDAISMPLADLEKKYKKLEKYQMKPIILVCATGADSPRAVTLLNQHGFQTFILDGGIRGWREADMPLVKS